MYAAARFVRLGQVAFMLLVCLLLSACQSKVTKDNFAKIKDGMTLQEVEAILGEGTVESGDGSGTAAQFGVGMPGAGKVAESHVWRSGDKEIRIFLRNGKVAQRLSKGF